MNQLPEAFQARMEALLKEEYEAFAASYEKERVQGLRLNPLKTDIRDTGRLEAAGFHLAKIPWAREGYYYGAKDRPGKHPYHEAGMYYIQEPSAMAAAELLDPQPGERVLDLCAAPGGKTTHIAGRMENRGLLISNEIHPARAKILSQNVERFGAGNVVVTNADPGQLARRFPEFFHRIAIDAPCSGEGMFRKDEAARGEWSPDHVRLCAERQREILDNGARMVKPGGRIVYSTCTFAPEENERTVLEFLRRHPDFHVRPAEPEKYGFGPGRPDWAGTPEETDGMGLEGTVRIWPHKTQGEGHYMAVLEREQREDVQAAPEKGEGKKGIRGAALGLPDREAWKDFEIFVRQTILEPAAARLLAGGGKGTLLFGDQLYLLPEEFRASSGDRALSGLKVLRPGLHIGTFKKKRFEPSHSLALFLRPSEAACCLNLADGRLEEMKAAVSYLTGAALPAADGLEGRIPEKSGWVLVCAGGCSLGWAKYAGGVLKNHYPKGLRWN